MAKIINNVCKKCGTSIGATVEYCGETLSDSKSKGVCLKESPSK